MFRFSARRLMSIPEATKVIASHPVVVFSKKECFFSTRAKCILAQLEYYPKVVELDAPAGAGTPEEIDALQDHFLQTTGESTVPRIFIGGKSIGGCNELEELAQDGKLEELMETALGKAGAGA